MAEYPTNNNVFISRIKKKKTKQKQKQKQKTKTKKITFVSLFHSKDVPVSCNVKPKSEFVKIIYMDTIESLICSKALIYPLRLMARPYRGFYGFRFFVLMFINTKDKTTTDETQPRNVNVVCTLLYQDKHNI